MKKFFESISKNDGENNENAFDVKIGESEIGENFSFTVSVPENITEQEVMDVIYVAYKFQKENLKMEAILNKVCGLFGWSWKVNE